MNEEIKRKADELVEKFHPHVDLMWDSWADVNCAILSTKNTIEVLNEVVKYDKKRYGIQYTPKSASIQLAEQKQILTELESRI